jgi:hypothetical protein
VTIGPLNERSEPGLSLAVDGEGLCQGCVVSRRTERLLTPDKPDKRVDTGDKPHDTWTRSVGPVAVTG